MEWPARSDYRVMALVHQVDGTSTMLSKFGTRRHPNDHQLSIDGVSVRPDDSGIDIDLRVVAPGTCIAAMVYRPPRARRTFADAPPRATCDDLTLTMEAESASTYTWVPYLLTVTDDGGVNLDPVNLQSAPQSERRPAFIKGQFTMEAGLLNCFQ